MVHKHRVGWTQVAWNVLLFSDMQLTQSISPPLWSRLKYLNKHRMSWNQICHFIFLRAQEAHMCDFKWCDSVIWLLIHLSEFSLCVIFKSNFSFFQHSRPHICKTSLVPSSHSKTLYFVLIGKCHCSPGCKGLIISKCRPGVGGNYDQPHFAFDGPVLIAFIWTD